MTTMYNLWKERDPERTKDIWHCQKLTNDTGQHSQWGWTDVCVCVQDLLGNTMRKA